MEDFRSAELKLFELFLQGGEIPALDAVKEDTLGAATLDALRKGGREVAEEALRLREILRAINKADLGEGALIEILSTSPNTLRVAVCCATRDENSLLATVTEFLAGRLEGGKVVASGQSGVTTETKTSG